MKPFIYGFFDRKKHINSGIKVEPAGLSPEAHIYSAGYQSFANGDTEVHLYARIYNQEELMKIFGLATSNTAELAYQIYQKEGTKGFRRFNGKFTAIVYHGNKVIIIRDRNGEGRMIYFTKDFFTDSYQRLNDFKDFTAKPDLTGITTFLKIGYIPAPITSLEGVQKIPAGEILVVENGKFKFEELYGYNEIISANRKERSLGDAIEQYAELLKQSLRRRIDGNETVGALLSGGYDSGGNIALLSEIHTGKLKSYSIGFKDNPASELPYAKMMAEKFGAEHHEYIMDGTEIEFLPEIIDFLGDPFSESGFMLNHSAMKMVSTEYLPVVMGGDGNDQYFGAGIRETAVHYKMSKAGVKPFSVLFDKLSDNSMFDHDNLAFRIHFQNQKILKVMEPETFGFHDYQLKKMFELNTIKPHTYLDDIPKNFKDYNELFLQRNYYLHIRHSVNEVIIYKASRLSEQFGVNLAFSYIDNDLYQFLQELPINLRAKGNVEECMKGKGVTKFILKQLVKPKLPDAVTNRPKQGGFSPLEIFFNNEARRKSIYRYISQSKFAETLKHNGFLEDFFNKYEALSKGQTYWFWHKQVKSNQLINLLIITLWWDRVIENRKRENLSAYIS
jgi:asparagine synthase (glutamine-hydrolysing)